MKRFVVALMSLCLLSFSILAQTERTTRPRVITAPTPREDSSSEPKLKRPPVMIGDTKTSSPTATPTTPSGEVVEEDNEVIKVETNLVTFPVSVLDRDGRFITGLKKEDFQIFENGVEQQIDSFATVEQPFTVILMIDVSPSTAFRIDEIHEAAVTFVDQLRRDDKVIVISFDEKFRVLSPATNNRSVLQNAIRRAEFGDGTSLYDAVDNVINRELSRIEGRKAVVLFTDGVDTTSRRADYQSTVRATEEIDALFYPIRYDTSVEMANRNGGTNYPQRRRGGSGDIVADILAGILGGGNVQIGGGSAGGSREDYEKGKRYLEELARNSGGRKFEANNDLSAAFSGIAEELRRQYSLGYYPETVGQKGERKKIRVRVKRPNLVVRAKDSYIVGTTEKKLAGK
ncbi:MAG: VWA domain-containing protein [Acidobacteria bacterium]|jgi:VWFA-related protein|nr:VWA domain-containing protein [Acidobacteriota bacterium]MBA4122631.1 VWA domain-containing protein [Acidobacteriota bacterium]